MQIEGVALNAAAETDRREERFVGDLAAEMQVHQLADSSPADGDSFQQHRNSEQGRSVWLPDVKQTVYRVIDAESGEVIQQVPSEQVMQVARNIEKFLTCGNADEEV
jgi:hypothetical protein